MTRDELGLCAEDRAKKMPRRVEEGLTRPRLPTEALCRFTVAYALCRCRSLPVLHDYPGNPPPLVVVMLLKYCLVPAFPGLQLPRFLENGESCGLVVTVGMASADASTQAVESIHRNGWVLWRVEGDEMASEGGIEGPLLTQQHSTVGQCRCRVGNGASMSRAEGGIADGGRWRGGPWCDGVERLPWGKEGLIPHM